MQISGLQSPSVFPSQSFPRTSQSSGASFPGSLSDGIGSGGSSAVQEFMSYAEETPAQRLFTNWLAGQDISQAQYEAMSPAQQEALVKKFEQQLKQELNPDAQDAGTQQPLAGDFSLAGLSSSGSGSASPGSASPGSASPGSASPGSAGRGSSAPA